MLEKEEMLRYQNFWQHGQQGAALSQRCKTIAHYTLKTQ